MKKFGLKILDIYIIKKFLGTFFYSILLIVSIAVIFDLAENWIISWKGSAIECYNF
jgi:lipopolysaccharide export system permease protein